VLYSSAFALGYIEVNTYNVKVAEKSYQLMLQISLKSPKTLKIRKTPARRQTFRRRDLCWTLSEDANDAAGVAEDAGYDMV
jgi:hypothetical protein